MSVTGIESCEARFACAACGELAGRVRLLAGGEQWTDRSQRSLDALADIDAVLRPTDQAALVVDTFDGVESRPVPPDQLDAVASAIAAHDAPALYQLAYSYAPFCCPECASSYCGEHWTWRRFDDGEFRGIEGNCQRGHFHVLCY
jgi:hypothetical protein